MISTPILKVSYYFLLFRIRNRKTAFDSRKRKLQNLADLRDNVADLKRKLQQLDEQLEFFNSRERDLANTTEH